MGLKWEKIKLLLASKACITSGTHPGHRHDGNGSEEDASYAEHAAEGFASQRRSGVFHRSASDCARLSSSLTYTGILRPTLSSSEKHTSGSQILKSSCSICLEALKAGNGQALFTAECSHVFHFSCIATNVRHGNLVCPICRARWKDVPWQGVRDVSRSGSHRRNPSADLHIIADYAQTEFLSERRRRNLSLQYVGDGVLQSGFTQDEPESYNDDECLSQITYPNAKSSIVDADRARMPHNQLTIQTYTEISSVPAIDYMESFTVLLHLHAPSASANKSQDVTSSSCPKKPNLRAPIDLVAVLDTSGSMAGRKLLLLKEAMGFVIRNLSFADRLSIVAFSSNAARMISLRKMGEEGQRQAIQAMDALVASGGTNIAEGLTKGVKILKDRRDKNPISSIMLLSDGQDTYSMSSGRQLPFLLSGSTTDARRLVPRSIRCGTSLGHLQTPIHTFGFGTDHDSSTMHAIAEVSGGTFSFIQAEDMVQDAFAQCIGGLLSVVAQDVELTVSCLSSGVRINAIHAGSYQSTTVDEGRQGKVRLGDLYAEEERDILIDLKLPAVVLGGMSMPLLTVVCAHKDPIRREVIQIPVHELHIDRPLASEQAQPVVSLEVDRQRNRLQTAAMIVEARSLADEGNFEAAQSCLQSARMQLEISPSGRAGDQLCTALDFELKEMHEKMVTRQVYERTGRAYLLSAQSSHLRQRATTRGDSLDGLTHDYQTQSMVDMVALSQTRPYLDRNVLPGLPSGYHKDIPQDRIPATPNRSSGRSLFRRMSAKVLRSYEAV